jgi:hypothetical protein
MNTFKKRLEFYMIKEKFNPTSLSRAAGLNITAVRDILAHKGDPNTGINTLIKLCRALNVTLHQLHPAVENLYSLDHRRLKQSQETKGKRL